MTLVGVTNISRQLECRFPNFLRTQGIQLPSDVVGILPCAGDAKAMATNPTVHISCPYCDSVVQAKVLAERLYDPVLDGTLEPQKYQFLECSYCRAVLVGWTEWEKGIQGEGWGRLIRKWPRPATQLHSNIPPSVRRSLEEAKRCFRCKAFMACAVMCGRAIESLCKDKVKAEYLGEGLKKLKAATIIDDKLFEWGDALRNERNIGAHAGEATVSRQTANDLLDFTLAIAEYVYVLDDNFKSYKERKARMFSPPAQP